MEGFFQLLWVPATHTGSSPWVCPPVPVLPSQPPGDPGRSRINSHLKILNLITFAKDLIPGKVTLPVPGAGTSYLWGHHSAAKAVELDQFSMQKS